eukprot:1067125-Rhodomonas_salina.2
MLLASSPSSAALVLVLTPSSLLLSLPFHTPSLPFSLPFALPPSLPPFTPSVPFPPYPSLRTLPPSPFLLSVGRLGDSNAAHHDDAQRTGEEGGRVASLRRRPVTCLALTQGLLILGAECRWSAPSMMPPSSTGPSMRQSRDHAGMDGVEALAFFHERVTLTPVHSQGSAVRHSKGQSALRQEESSDAYFRIH